MPNPSKDAETGKSPVSEINLTAWFEQHDALVYHLVHMCAKVLAKAKVELDDEATALVAHAYDSVRAHAKKLVGDGVPVVLAKDGKHTINYDQFAEARAKIKILTFELNELRATVAAEDQFIHGRRAMHAEVIMLFQRPIDQLEAAAQHHPKLAEQLDKVTHLLRTMQTKIRDLPVEQPVAAVDATPAATILMGAPA